MTPTSQLEGKAAPAAEVTVGFFNTALQSKEGFDVYGEKLSFKWREFRNEKHGMIRLVDGKTFVGKVETERIEVPVYPETVPDVFFNLLSETPAISPLVRLAHEFVSSIVVNRKPYINAKRAIDFVLPGICAHKSAMNGGKPVSIQYLLR